MIDSFVFIKTDDAATRRALPYIFAKTYVLMPGAIADVMMAERSAASDRSLLRVKF